MKYLKYILLLLGAGLAMEMRADEGMWMIHAIDAALEKKMQERGLELSARETTASATEDPNASGCNR